MRPSGLPTRYFGEQLACFARPAEHRSKDDEPLQRRDEPAIGDHRKGAGTGSSGGANRQQ
jgi:hypothetical protein